MIDEEMENEWNNLFELKGKLDAINKILKLHEDNELIFDKNWLLINVAGLTQEEIDVNEEYKKNNS